jgi:uncharacterized protein (DUF302 family)
VLVAACIVLIHRSSRPGAAASVATGTTRREPPEGAAIMSDSTVELRTLLHLPVESALQQVRAALHAEGFIIVADVDVQALLRQQLATQFYPYWLLGVCDGDLMYRMLEVDPRLGLYLPHTVVVHDTGEGIEVHIQDPGIVLTPAAPPELVAAVEAARARFGRVIAALGAVPT